MTLVLSHKDTSGHYRRFFNEPDIPRACKIALRVTSRRAYEYALSKWKLSHRVVSVPVIDFDPSQSERMPKSPYAFDHVRYAYAIIMCYSVLEELGLEVRASKEQPSTIKGEWNPAVKDELMKRLKRARVNVTEKFDWMIRGQRTKLEKEHPARVVSPAPWAQWDVRDAVVELVDAIAHVSWLRSKISSHRMKHDLVRLLSIYDVANAQFLVRRLLLEPSDFGCQSRWKAPEVYGVVLSTAPSRLRAAFSIAGESRAIDPGTDESQPQAPYEAVACP